MAEWLYEAGIGENRAVLVEDDSIVEALIEREGAGLAAGAILSARLTEIVVPGRRGIATTETGEQALVEPLPPGVTHGATFVAEVMREAIGEARRAKLAKVRAAPAGETPRPAPTLAERIAATGTRVTRLTNHGPDRLEAAGWSELLEEATTGEIRFIGGALDVALTPAMTLIDVDGHLPPAALAVAGARAASQAIRRHGIAGSIGIDLPTVPDKSARLAAAEAFDSALPQPFERTAVNGFGFLQIVRRRERRSLPELIQRNPVRAAALALLRTGERAQGAGVRTLVAAPAVIALIAAESAWTDALARRAGTAIALRAEPALAISAAYVETEHP
ncbi:hypothetical protein FHS96_002553 [Sphingomonas zeicaulis]|uniref:ribonuclease n=1 Tax=Sphingomonas zeicaulis TaxID=1632740 RepID=UPI003D24E1E8